MRINLKFPDFMGTDQEFPVFFPGMSQICRFLPGMEADIGRRYNTIQMVCFN